MLSSLIRGSTNVIKISPNNKDRTDKAVKMKVNVITIELLNDLIASGNILPIPGIANTVSVITAPLMAKIIDAGTPLTIGMIAFFKICLLKISFCDRPLDLANFT